jgi:hypothetical protein
MRKEDLLLSEKQFSILNLNFERIQIIILKLQRISMYLLGTISISVVWI